MWPDQSSWSKQQFNKLETQTDSKNDTNEQKYGNRKSSVPHLLRAPQTSSLKRDEDKEEKQRQTKERPSPEESSDHQYVHSQSCEPRGLQRLQTRIFTDQHLPCSLHNLKYTRPQHRNQIQEHHSHSQQRQQRTQQQHVGQRG